MYSINFTKANTKFCLSLRYNGDNSYLFVNGTEIIKFRAKDSIIVPKNLCLGNVSKDFSASNIKKLVLIVTFMILVLMMTLLILIMLKTYIFNKKEWNSMKMFKFIKQIFISTMMSFNSILNVKPLECISIKKSRMYSKAWNFWC